MAGVCGQTAVDAVVHCNAAAHAAAAVKIHQHRQILLRIGMIDAHRHRIAAAGGVNHIVLHPRNIHCVGKEFFR